jgi:signal transduction histidine kinase
MTHWIEGVRGRWNSLSLRDRLIDLGMTFVIASLGVFEYFVFGEVYTDNSVIENTREPEPMLLVLTVATILPVAVRRVTPVWSVIVGHVGYVLTTGLDFQVTSSAQFSLLIPLYGLALYTAPRVADLTRGAVTVAMVGWVGLGALVSNIPAGLIPIVLMVYVAVWIIGNNARARQENARLLEERAQRAEEDRESEAIRAVRTERERIARELHDVVAHSITVMTVQAAGAKRVLHEDPAQTADALDAIEATGRQTLNEMRRMVGVIRADEENMGLAPQPGLTGLPDLIEHVEASGLPVRWSMTGEAVPLPPGIELTAYRIVQEALTNAMKHAGPEASADVEIRFAPDGLHIDVVDDGRGAATWARSGTGHGLLGMRERVNLYGGDVQAGPHPGGGYQVKARIPAEALA